MVNNKINKDFVLERLSIKKKLDPEYLAYGAAKHKYNLFPPIKEEKLKGLEKQFSVILPEDYRRFILEIGNGGAAPESYLQPIEEALGYDAPIGKIGKSGSTFIRPDEIMDNEYQASTGLLLLCDYGCAYADFLVVAGKEYGFVWTHLEWASQHVPVLKNPPHLKTNDLPRDKREEAEERWIKELLSAKDEEKMTFTDWYISWLNEDPYIDPIIKKT